MSPHRAGISVLIPLAAVGVSCLAVTWAPGAEAATRGASLSLTPSSGGQGSSVVADFQLFGRGGCAGSVEFSWDSTLVGIAGLTQGAFGGCDAVLLFAVPTDASVGGHTVSAATVSSLTYAAASARFTVGFAFPTTTTATTAPATTAPATATTQATTATTTDSPTTTSPTTTTTSWTPPPYTPVTERPIALPTSNAISAGTPDIPPARVSARAAAFGFIGFAGFVGIALLTFAIVHIRQGRRTRR